MARISQVDEIKERLDIVDVISGYVPLKKAGRNFKGLCPFHAEKTPSFIVFPDTGTWHCFGACNTGGDIFTFIMKKENVDFGEALRLLADKAGIVLETRRPEMTEAERRLDRLREIHAAAASFYHHLLVHSPRAQGAREYVERRGLSQETVERFELGYAPDEWDALLRYLTGKGYAPADLLEAGLIIEREGSAGYYDRFRHRLIIPIRDRRGRTIGFGARALDDTLPKYLNSPQTPLFDKSAVLFGLDKAARGIRARGEAVIVEGYMDVLTAHQHGIDNVVASMGTALTETQLQQLAQLTSRFILALDADVAGDQATLRGLHLVRQTVGRRKVPRLTAQGTLQQETRLMVDLRILTLPAGYDPDELIREDVTRWEELVRHAQPLVEYYLNQVIKGLDLDDPANKSKVVQEMKPILLELSDEVERYHYIQRLARKVRVDEAAVEREVLGQKAPAARIRRPPAKVETRWRKQAWAESGLVDLGTPAPTGPRDFGIEEQCVFYLVCFPRLIHPLSFAFAEAGVPFVEPEDFSRAENQAIYVRIKQNAEQGLLASAEELLNTLEEPLASYLETLLELEASTPHVPEDKTLEDLIRCTFRLKARSLRQNLERLYYLLEESDEALDREQVLIYTQLIQQHLSALQQIDKTLHARSMLGRRQQLEPRIG